MSEDLIGKYRQLLGLSRLLLEAAQASEWDRLLELERQRVASLKEIQALPEVSAMELVPQDTAELAQLIGEIQQCDTQTVPLVKAWMDELHDLLDSLANERKLGEIYS